MNTQSIKMKQKSGLLIIKAKVPPNPSVQYENKRDKQAEHPILILILNAMQHFAFRLPLIHTHNHR